MDEQKGVILPPDPLIGQRFLLALNGLVATARIHLDNNQLLHRCAEEFQAVLEELLKNDDEINLVATPGALYLQQKKIVLQPNAAGLGRKLLAYLKRRQIEGFRFNRSAAYTSYADLLTFIRLLNRSADQEKPEEWLNSHLEAQAIHWVELIDTSRAQSLAALFSTQQQGTDDATASSDNNQTGPTGTQRVENQPSGFQENQSNNPAPAHNRRRRHHRRTAKAVKTYSHALNSLRQVADKIAAHRTTGLGQSVQLVQHMVDLVINDDNVLLDLSTIHDYDDYTFTHSVNVCILSLCLGYRIGLGKVPLSRLGLCALFHDIGKLDVPYAILNKPGRLDDDEFRIIQQHSVNSVRRILKLRASYDRKAGILLAPFEHHLRHDLTGYPKTPRKKPVSLFGSILTIADVYDAISAPRVYRSTSMSPDKALGFMLENSGTIFHPILLKVFINMLGIYPIGTLLVLEDERMGLVCHAPDETVEPDGLWVVLLEQENGVWRKDSYICLGDRNKPSRLSIRETRHPADLGIQPATLLL